MKSIICVFTLLACFTCATAQTTYIANSNPGAIGGTNVFTDLGSVQQAINAASDGDIIYVVPSPLVYFASSLNGKSLTLRGGGFNPANGGPVSTIQSLINLGDNVRLSGLVITDEVYAGNTYANIMIDKCRIRSILGMNISNLVIQGCILGESSSTPVISFDAGSANVTISNNIIYTGSSAAFSNLHGAMIRNNLIVAGGSSNAFEQITNCTIQNNIFFAMALGGSAGSFSNNVQRNNLSTPSSNPFFSTTNGNTSSNNLESSDPLFASFILTPTFNFGSNLALRSGSPALGTGFGGVDMGVFGGASPYDVYGTSLPTIQNVIAPHSTAQGINMSVRIQAKGN